jgi:murein peptide amidase A
MKPNAKFILLFLLAAAIFINGCAVIRPATGRAAVKCSAPVKTCIAGVSVKGRSIKYIKFGDSPNTTLLIGSIHGDEQAGALLLNRFCGYLKENKSLLCDNTVIIVPIVNPDGFAKKTRYNADGIDLNRNFPSDNRVNDEHSGSFALSAPESWHLYKILNTLKPKKILSFHDTLGCIDYDGPADAIAGRLAAKCKLPIRKLGARPGSFGSYAGQTLNIPIITIELSEEDVKKNAKELLDDYKDMLIEAISF